MVVSLVVGDHSVAIGRVALNHVRGHVGMTSEVMHNQNRDLVGLANPVD